MNPQPEPYVGQIFALIFSAVFFYYFIKAFNNPKHRIDLEYFTLGYIEDSNNVTVNIKNKTVQVKNTKPNIESQQLFIDCVDALHAIGLKKTEAKKRAKEIFTNMENPPTNIQDFLMIAMRKN